ncbi:ABC transporter ATP-binding protein [Brevibacillus ruminantium]|uniref:ABC transporter ATP-binding protein n=1 Tax=Brevibacillus ruminantium TaxID=2950604 RepID=A0ABY4WQZ4_9BACL|nr:ABC transporter ATP-binding protein [Brevibacillus ruminantium]
METLVKVQGLTKQYRNGRGVRDVSFEVARGDIFGLFGPNGAGKTTLLKMMTGLCRADRGSAILFGYELTSEFEKAMAQVGCMIQTADAYPYLSALDHLKLAARLYPEQPKARIQEVLDAVGLGAYRHEKVKGFSTGMKQRLALAEALLSAPQLVILDEPTNGLDIEGVVEFRELILQLAREKGVTFVISSHLIDEMERICNRIGILNNGRLISQGNVDELLNSQVTLEQFYLSQIQNRKEKTAHAASVR